MLPYLGICHAAALLILTLAALRSSPLDWITKLNAAILAGWTNLVLTAIVLSFGSALGQPVLFAAVSTVIAVGSALLLAGAGLMPATPGKPLVSFLEGRPRLARLLLAFFVVTGAGVLLGNLIIALAYLPNNPDTVTYRLSRIYWYRDAGSLAHFGTGIDARSIFYPFNGALLQYPIALYRWTNRLFSLVPFVAWTIIGLTVFRIARDLGACRTVAVGTAWLAALTPGVVVQATSTNDEILAAFPLLIAVQFAIRFHRGGAVADLCLALIAAALSIGTKLHAVFYWPFIVAAAGWLAWRLASGDRWRLSWPTSRRAVLTASTLALCAVLAAAFVVPNWRASGALMDTSFSDLVLNKPFKLLAGLQNLVLHAVQTAASPLPDLNPIARHPGPARLSHRLQPGHGRALHLGQPGSRIHVGVLSLRRPFAEHGLVPRRELRRHRLRVSHRDRRIRRCAPAAHRGRNRARIGVRRLVRHILADDPLHRGILGLSDLRLHRRKPRARVLLAQGQPALRRLPSGSPRLRRGDASCARRERPALQRQPQPWHRARGDELARQPARGRCDDRRGHQGERRRAPHGDPLGGCVLVFDGALQGGQIFGRLAASAGSRRPQHLLLPEIAGLQLRPDPHPGQALAGTDPDRKLRLGLWSGMGLRHRPRR